MRAIKVCDVRTIIGTAYPHVEHINRTLKYLFCFQVYYLKNQTVDFKSKAVFQLKVEGWGEWREGHQLFLVFVKSDSTEMFLSRLE